MVLVEGEANAVACWQMVPSLNLIGLPGQRALSQELADNLGHVPTVYLWLDSDEAAFASSAATARERLLAAGADEVRIVDSAGLDANEILLTQGQARGAELVVRQIDRAQAAVDHGDLILSELEDFLSRYIVMSPSEAVVAALWIVHCHAIDAAEETPHLHIKSPEKRCGKTRLMEVLAQLVPHPLRTANATEAAMFRAIDQGPRTLLFDEVDAIFGPKAKEHEDLRALINAGHRRGTPVIRCVGQGSHQQVVDFDVFCPKALAGIGELPATVSDRSLPIQLRRKAPTDQAKRLRHKELVEEAAPLQARAARWSSEALPLLRGASPELPSELDDRGQDACEPLLAIADVAGGRWPVGAREALVRVRGRRDESDESLGIRLLADVREAFQRRDTDRLSTDDLLRELADEPEAPWGEWNSGKGLSARGLARLLKRYGVKSKTIRLGENHTPKGYLREGFEDVWPRYLPARGQESATAPQPETDVADVADRPGPGQEGFDGFQR